MLDFGRIFGCSQELDTEVCLILAGFFGAHELETCFWCSKELEACLLGVHKCLALVVGCSKELEAEICPS